MSIELDIDLYSYASPANQCPAVFNANKTPKILFLSLSGIQTGSLWSPGNLPPPNGLWSLSASAACGWSLISSPYGFAYNTSPAPSVLLVETPPFDTYFQGYNASAGKFSFANQITTPTGNKYWGGSALLTSVIDIDITSLPALLSELNLRMGESVYCNPKAYSATQSVFGYWNPTDASFCNILFDVD